MICECFDKEVIDVLVAINEKGRTVKSHEEEKGGVFFCPCCKSEVILKKGEVKFPHFAHKQLVTCQGASESETLEHIQGKLLVAKNCERFGLSYELEAYLPEINQRADVLIEKKTAIEFQCSSLSIERLKERTEHYQSHGYQVFWVLGEDLGKTNRLTELKKHFLSFNHHLGYHDFRLNVKENKLIIRSYLANHHRGVVMFEKAYSLNDKSLLDILECSVYKASFMIDNPLREVALRKQEFAKKLVNCEPSYLKLQEAFYLNNQHLLHLPGYVYFPSFYHPVLKERDLFVRSIILEVLFQQQEVSYCELKQQVIEKLSSEFCVDYANLEKHQVIDYSVSIYLVFLREVGVIDMKNNENIRFFKKKVMNNEQIEKFVKIRGESLVLPLKYDMIIK